MRHRAPRFDLTLTRQTIDPRVLDKSVRQEAMKERYRLNIAYASLWPDMDGLCRSMNQELEIIWQPLVDEFL